MTREKAADLPARLEHRQTEQALAAEFELALLWAIGQVVFELEMDPAAHPLKMPAAEV
jgi:hypothetical protein